MIESTDIQPLRWYEKIPTNALPQMHHMFCFVSSRKKRKAYYKVATAMGCIFAIVSPPIKHLW